MAAISPTKLVERMTSRIALSGPGGRHQANKFSNAKLQFRNSCITFRHLSLEQLAANTFPEGVATGRQAEQGEEALYCGQRRLMRVPWLLGKRAGL